MKLTGVRCLPAEPSAGAPREEPRRVAPLRCPADREVRLDFKVAPGGEGLGTQKLKQINSPKIRKLGPIQTAPGLGTRGALGETKVRWHREEPGARHRATQTSFQRARREPGS